MKLTKALLIFVTALALSACGDDDENDNGKDEFGKKPVVVSPFKDMTPDEVIEEKYELAMLQCKLWHNLDAAVNLDQTPDAMFEQELLSALDRIRPFTMIGGSLHTSAKIEISVAHLDITDDLEFTDIGGKKYQMHHTPILKLALKSTVKANSRDWTLTSTKEPTLFENIENFVLSSSTRSNEEPGSYYNTHVVCTLLTKAKEEYKHHFKELN